VLAGACAAALVLPACTKQAPVAPSAQTATSADANAPRNSGQERSSELDWARAALQRNPTLELVATDTISGVFTIRNRNTGEMHTVKVSELAAVPVSSLTASVRPEAAATDASGAQTERSGSGTAAGPSPTPGSQTTAASMPNYTIERKDGQVRVSGPGVSIVSAGGSDVSASNAQGNQRTVEPIICEGRRMLHFDNRDIYVDGDAIVARGGCELHITNSRVAASGTGVVVGDATVHISNSTIEGSAASFDAGDGAKVFVRSSTFEGLPRRTASAVVQDQGGNHWR
jgi:hypothetical protein